MKVWRPALIDAIGDSSSYDRFPRLRLALEEPDSNPFKLRGAGSWHLIQG